ncbi:MAG: hypothetical protein IIU19_05340 [Oscillospiraceae bacterium]|jgi:Predicted esterase|nr:hypothetical protein [Oscillospiraceae bacterium]MBQ4000104.1 hypothetical protein [Oscillospiraceae bacterium]MBQ4239709.1 hypothetical protein [Oscillospiraceae bacterium]MBQ5412792.1 hypothetical protein [Oscillospiraceae bacterium]
MGICKFNYRSQACGLWLDVIVTIPTSQFSYYDMREGARHNDRAPADGNYPAVYKPGMKFQTIYMIHGGGDDDTLPYRYMSIERYADANNVMLVTPNIPNSFGVNTNYGVDYQTFLAEELPTVIQSLFPSAPGRENNFIAGFAMGGNVALGTALMHPELYSAAVDVSGGIGLTVNTEQFAKELSSQFTGRFPLVGATFGRGEDLPGSKHDMRKFALENIEKGVELPKFYLVCGSEEGNIGKRVEADAKTLKEMGYDVDFTCYEGYNHFYPLWDMYFEKMMNEILPLKREAIFP